MVGLAAGGDQLMGVRMKTGEKTAVLQKELRETSLNCALQWISFRQVDSLRLQCTQPVPTKAFAVHHEEHSNFSNGGCSHPLSPSMLGISSQMPSLLILSEVSHLRKLHPPLSFLHSAQHNLYFSCLLIF